MDAAELRNEGIKLPELSGIRFEIDDEITLRQFTPDDARLVLEAVKRNEAHLMEFMHWMTPDYSLEMARQFIDRAKIGAEKRESMGFGIFRGNTLIGAIGFVHFETKARKTEIGYWIDREEQGKGIVSAATKLLIDLAFHDLGMNRVEIRCSAENARSAAIPKRFGFMQEGCIRQCEFRNGKLHDFLVFGLLKSEWKG